MEILDLVDGKPAGNGRLDKTDFMNLRRLQPREKLANAQANHASEYQRGVDNLIRGLVDLLPNPAGIWPLDDRAKWLRLAAGIFDLGYKAGDSEHNKISIVVVKPEHTEGTV
jgi:hypothetical protein